MASGGGLVATDIRGYRFPSTSGTDLSPSEHSVLRLGQHPLQHFNTTIADRLVENSEIFLLGGDSLRKSKNPNPPAE